ncbi:hypothetical protein [Nitrososphaera sp.]|uniref:hypothetical protein n=1 Tax=Nitrososphaera sp. TaxID=1971748 RepID=UPI00307CD760
MTRERLAFIGNPASVHYLIGRELVARGYEVKIIDQKSVLTTNEFDRSSRPSLAARAVHKYARWASLEPTYDVELRSFSTPYVKARHRAIIYHGSDLRDGLMPREYPAFYTTKDLAQYVDGEAVWLPRCAYTDIFTPQPRLPVKDEIVVGHFPSDPKYKGTELVLEAVRLLSSGDNRKIKVRLLMEKRPHEQMPQLIKQCHVVCDQFLYGAYGVLGIESLMMNRPIVCYVRPEFFDYDEMKGQIVNCEPTPEGIAEAILRAVDHPVDAELVRDLYSPRRSADILEGALRSWGYLK